MLPTLATIMARTGPLVIMLLTGMSFSPGLTLEVGISAASISLSAWPVRRERAGLAGLTTSL